MSPDFRVFQTSGSISSRSATFLFLIFFQTASVTDKPISKSIYIYIYKKDKSDKTSRNIYSILFISLQFSTCFDFRQQLEEKVFVESVLIFLNELICYKKIYFQFIGGVA